MRSAESTTLDTPIDLEALLAALGEHLVRLAILFVSHATETTHTRSDIDLAIEFEDLRPADPCYNEVFLGLGAGLSDTLETDDVDLVDLHAVPPALATPTFENGILLLGDHKHTTELQSQITPAASATQSARARLDAALEKVDDHLGDDNTGPPVSGDPH